MGQDQIKIPRTMGTVNTLNYPTSVVLDQSCLGVTANVN